MNNKDDQIAELEATVRDLRSVLKQGDTGLLVTFRLTPQKMKILGLLMSVPLVSPDMISQRLEIATEVRVAINRLRKDLKPFGVKIESRRRLGYWFSEETKAKVKALVTEACKEGDVVTEEVTSYAGPLIMQA